MHQTTLFYNLNFLMTPFSSRRNLAICILKCLRAGEISEQLISLAAHLEDPSSVSSTQLSSICTQEHIATHRHIEKGNTEDTPSSVSVRVFPEKASKEEKVFGDAGSSIP